MTTAASSKPTADEKKAMHKAAEAQIQTFSYKKPPPQREGKDWVYLGKSDLVRGMVQVVKEGGENNLHYHKNSDGFWFVLNGRVRFYGVGNELIGEFGPHEGVLIPAGARYWFEKIGSEELEILQVVGINKAAGPSERINLEAHKAWMKESFLQVYEDDKA